MRINFFEAGIIGLLLAITSVGAVSDFAGLLLVLGHIVALLALFIFCRSVIAKISRRAGGLFFAIFALLLIVEASIQYLTGLHLNWFVLSLLMESGLEQNGGLSAPLGGGAILLVSAGLYWLSARFKTSVTGFAVPRIIAIGVTAAVSTQMVYAVAYYHGSTKAIQIRRNMPFFWTPHPYQSNKLLGYIFPPRGENPFSLSKIHTEDTEFAPKRAALAPITERVGDSPPNILIIVADSLRSKDIEQNPGLAPTLTATRQHGFLSLDHYSVSNCTHFSLYSMFTGELPTGYGAARSGKKKVGILPEIYAAGYTISTAESASLDWYDLSDIILPAKAQRWVGKDGDTLENDRIVTVKTIEQLSGWQQSKTPGLHLAYYYGTHFPYSKTLGSSVSPNLDRYKTTIGLFDVELAKILAALDQYNLANDTLVIVTSDHGEEFFENGRVGHASRLSDEQVRVPLLILGAQKRSSIPLSHKDIPELVYSAIDPTRSVIQPSEPIYLANCGYDFPAAFSVLSPNGRYDFEFDNGYLIPVNHQSGESRTNMRQAAAGLLRSIR